MKKRLNEQLKDCPVVTQEALDTATVKTFSSGRPKKVGDKVMYGFLLEEVDETIDEVEPHLAHIFGEEVTQKMKRQTLTLITFHPDEFGKVYRLSKMDDGKHTYPHIEKVQK